MGGRWRWSSRRCTDLARSASGSKGRNIRRRPRRPGRRGTCVAILAKPVDDLTDEDAEALTAHYLTIAPLLDAILAKKVDLESRLAGLKPETTVPILRELRGDQRRTTRMQRRGNFMDIGDEVEAGLPGALFPLPDGSAVPDRLAMARWLVDEREPADAPGGRQSVLGAGLRPRPGGNKRGIRLARGTSDASGTARLAGDRAGAIGLGLEGVAPAAGHVEHVSAIVGGCAGDCWRSTRTTRCCREGPRFRLSAEMVRDQALAVVGPSELSGWAARRSILPGPRRA